MADGHIPKDLFYGELVTGARSRGRPYLRFKDVCKRDMKACNINTESWEAFADNRITWKQHVSQGLESGEKAVRTANDGARAKRAARQQACTTSQQSSVFVSFAAEAALPELVSLAIQDDALHPRALFHSHFD